MIKVEIDAGRTSKAAHLSPAHVEHITEVVARTLRIRRLVSVSLAFVGEATMRKVNAKYRGKHQATDVLSFTFGKQDVFGEILLCSSVAKKQAHKAKRPLSDELIELFVHGLLHLFGYDHQKPKDAANMFSIQEHIMKKLL